MNQTRLIELPECWLDNTKGSYSAELQLLLYCARIHLNCDDIQSIQSLLVQDIDWSVLIQLSRRHGVLPLLYQNLTIAGTASIDLQALQQLRDYSQGTAFQNAVFTRALLKIVDLLAKNNIQALPFKGPLLAVSAYNNLSLRSFCDLDIIIRKKDFLKAIEVLTVQGNYRPKREWSFLKDSWETLYLQSYREFSLTNGIVTIDLHQELTVERYLSSKFSFDDLWNDRESVVIASQEVPNFAQVDVLLYLCIHASKESWRKLKWICDIAEFTRVHSDLDWQNLLERAQNLHCQRRLLVGLLLAHTLLGLFLPDFVLKRAEIDKICLELTDEFTERLFWEENQLGRKFTLEKFCLHLKSLESLEDQLKSEEEIRRLLKTVLIKILPNSKDKEYLPLSRNFYFLYYFIRLYRLAKERFSLSSQ